MGLDGQRPLQGWIYGIRTTYSTSYSPGFVSRAGPAGTNVEDIHDRVHALNESVQSQLEEANRRYMDLQEQHKKDKEQWMQ